MKNNFKVIALSLMAAISLIAACEKVDIKEPGRDHQQELVRDTVYVQDTVLFLDMSITKVSFPHEGGSFCISIDSSLEYEVETGADWVVIGENCSTPSETLHVVVDKNTAQEPRTAVFTITYTTGESREITIEQAAYVLFSGGAGTAESPYLISTGKDLVTLSDYMARADSAAVYSTKHYRQTADIDMSAVTDYVPVGLLSELRFAGIYDGADFKVSNLMVNQKVPGMPAGLFGFVGEGAVVKNVVINGITIVSSSYYTGAVAGDIYCSTIENCTVNGAEINNTGAPASGDLKDNSLTGGVVGHAYEGKIRDCKFDGTVYAATHRSGGILGVASSSEAGVVSVEDCTFSGNVSTGWIGGGIVGFSRGGTEIIGCVSRGNVSTTGNSAGGIVGRISKGIIKDCIFTSDGSVNQMKPDAGGIVGMVYASGISGGSQVQIENCASYGVVRGLNNVGGIIGLIDQGTGDVLNVQNCVAYGCEVYATGSMTGSNKWQLVGGICGYAKGSGTVTFSNCLSTAETVSGLLAASGGIGGFVGYIDGAHMFTNCAVCMRTSDILYNSGPVTSLSNGYYGSFFGRSPKAATLTDCYAPADIQFGPTNGSETRTACEGISASQMTDGTLLNKLNANVSALSGAKSWVAGADGTPITDGLPADPDRKQGKKLRISIIGDSISTFAGWVPNGYGCHYPKTDPGYDVTSADKTWWHRLIYHYLPSARLDMNLSYAGTTVVRNSIDDKDQYYYGRDFCARYIECSGMGRPDVIFIHGGTNDCWQTPRNEYLLGTQSMLSKDKPSDEAMAPIYQAADDCTTLEQAKQLDNSTFVSAYVKLIRMMQLQYPSVKIVCVIGDHAGSADHHAIQESILDIAEHYKSHCRVVDFPAISGWQTSGPPLSKCGGSHPDAAGMDFMASEIYKKVGSWITAE